MGYTSVKLEQLEDNQVLKFENKLELAESGVLLFTIKAMNFEASKPISFKRLLSAKNPEETVFEKLKNCRGKKMDDNSVKSWARNLSDPERLKETYLTIFWVDSLEVQKKLDKEDDDLDENEMNESFQQNEIIEDKNDIALQEDVKQKFSKELKIKLLFVDHLKDDNFKNGFRKLISPVINEIGDYSKFGLFHTALLIGPWLIEWNDSGLCIPRKCLSKAAFLTADVGEISTKDSLESVRNKLANVIADWNVNYGYTTISKHKKNVGNCQDFLDAIFLELGLEFKFEGAIGEFIKSLKKNGTTKLKYPVSDEIKKKFEIKENEIEFKTHEELDLFVKNLFEKDFTFDMKYPSDYNLLKSFDRAFWLKHLKCRNEIRYLKNVLKHSQEKYQKRSTEELENKIQNIKKDLEFQNGVNEFSKPFGEIKEMDNEEDDDEETECPFSHPAETKSFW